MSLLKSLLAASFAGALAACASSSSTDATSSAAETSNAAVVRFDTSDWTPTWSGDVHAGGSLKIDYDFDRLPECRNQGSVVSWVVEVNWRFDGGTTHTAALDGSPGASETLDGSTIEVPAGAKSIELWFENRAVGGYDHCTAWDSALGANYKHDL